MSQPTRRGFLRSAAQAVAVGFVVSTGLARAEKLVAPKCPARELTEKEALLWFAYGGRGQVPEEWCRREGLYGYEVKRGPDGQVSSLEPVHANYLRAGYVRVPSLPGDGVVRITWEDLTTRRYYALDRGRPTTWQRFKRWLRPLPRVESAPGEEGPRKWKGVIT